MKSTHHLLTCLLICCVSAISSAAQPEVPDPTAKEAAAMQLGNFSISLTVKDLAASRAFYEKLGFTSVAGDSKKWQVMKNGTTKVGLFQGMFEKNTLTFNPGWDSDGKPLASFQDVRDIQKALTEKGLSPTVAADEATTGPAFFMMVDPDGNPVLIDQHVPKPAKK
jgi:catechol 2,3-dioxygenase-like lactoylglutathione lyase family enzyme